MKRSPNNPGSFGCPGSPRPETERCGCADSRLSPCEPKRRRVEAGDVAQVQRHFRPHSRRPKIQDGVNAWHREAVGPFGTAHRGGSEAHDDLVRKMRDTGVAPGYRVAQRVARNAEWCSADPFVWSADRPGLESFRSDRDSPEMHRARSQLPVHTRSSQSPRRSPIGRLRYLQAGDSDGGYSSMQDTSTSSTSQDSDGGYSSRDSSSSESSTSCKGAQKAELHQQTIVCSRDGLFKHGGSPSGIGVMRLSSAVADADQGRAGSEDWAQLPGEALVCVFRALCLKDVGRCAQVCKDWQRASQDPRVWRRVEFVLGSPARPETTPRGLVNFILEKHVQDLKFVVFKTDSSVESAQSACQILSRLVKCSLKTLAVMSGAARPVFLDVDHQQFASALTLVLDHSPTLRALAVDNTPVDDPSLEALAHSSSSSTLQRLRCKSCPRLSPGGVLALADHCRCLRELSLSYSLLSDELLLALSSEQHARLEVLRVDVYTDVDAAAPATLRPIAPSSWRALVSHSPQINLVMYLFAIHEESFDNLFTSYIPVTHLYFGDHVPNSVLGRVGQFCPRLVELVVSANGNTPIDEELLDIARNCGQLSSLGLAECQVTCSAFVQFVSRCGRRLSQLVVMEECLIEDMSFDLMKTCKTVSSVLGRDWSPEFMPIW